MLLKTIAWRYNYKKIKQAIEINSKNKNQLTTNQENLTKTIWKTAKKSI